MAAGEVEGKTKEADTVQLYKLGDIVTFNGENCRVTAVEPGGSAWVTDTAMKISQAETTTGHPQRLRLAGPHKQEYYPISGASVKLNKSTLG